MKGISSAVATLVIFLLAAILAVVALISMRDVIQTTAAIETIARGDTVLFAMLETGICTELGAPLKYVLGIGLASGGPASVTVNYGGRTGDVAVVGCITKFMKSINAEKYNFSVRYGNAKYVVLSGYDINEQERTEKIFIAVPNDKSGVAQVALSVNFPKQGNEVCPESGGGYFCTPATYCLLLGRSCDIEKYGCGAATCCCPENK